MPRMHTHTKLDGDITLYVCVLLVATVHLVSLLVLLYNFTLQLILFVTALCVRTVPTNLLSLSYQLELVTRDAVLHFVYSLHTAAVVCVFVIPVNYIH